MQTLIMQTLFDRAVLGVYHQGRKSLLPREDAGLGPMCAYRGTHGLKCAIGHLIDDAHYTPALEEQHRRSVSGRNGYGAAPASLYSMN